MKSLFISSLIIIILIITWIAAYNFISETVGELNALLDNMKDKIHKDNWHSAITVYNSINEKWKNRSSFLMLILDHEEMEKVNLTLERTKEYISIKDKSLVLGEMASLKFFFNHIKEKESLSLKNIF